MFSPICFFYFSIFLSAPFGVVKVRGIASVRTAILCHISREKKRGEKLKTNKRNEASSLDRNFLPPIQLFRQIEKPFSLRSLQFHRG